jgi:putative flavoprotein involved in K+ transport
MESTDVLIIGAGQAGLAMSYYLDQTNLTFRVVDANTRIGDSWRNRYDSLTLFSSRAYSSLPGLKLPGKQSEFPHKDEIADYLENYAGIYSFPILLSTKVERLEKQNEGFIAYTSKGVFKTKQVVVATGAFHLPSIPRILGRISEDVFQIHSHDYKNPKQVPDGATLIVGGGNSGAQIAAELARKQKVMLSTGHKISFVPKKIFGRSLFWWLDILGILKVPVKSRFAKFLQDKEPIIGNDLKLFLENGKVELRDRLISFNGNVAEFINGTTAHVRNIVWATGYKLDFRWISIPDVLDNDGNVRHERGVSQINGLYFVGLPWLYRRGSAQLSGVGLDCEYISEKVIASLKENAGLGLRYFQKRSA